jgi:predicted RNA-binding protein with PUA domain
MAENENKVTLLKTPPAAVKLPHPGDLAVAAVKNMVGRGKHVRQNELNLLNEVLAECKKTNPGLVDRYIDAAEEFQVAMRSAEQIVELLQDNEPPADEG